MTRKQQIEQAWLHGDAENLTSFRMGAEWADAHPISPWISVNDRLPKGEDNPDEYNAPHRARSSSNVIITDGTIINRGYYSYARMRWEWNEGEINVTHWMPIPEL